MTQVFDTKTMASYAIISVVTGVAEVRVDQEIVNIEEGQCLIAKPATSSMKAENGGTV